MEAVGRILPDCREVKLEAGLTGIREFVAIALVGCLMHVGFLQQAQAMAAVERSCEFQQKVEQLGAGAGIRVTLKNQQKTPRGMVESFDDSAFRLQPGGNGERGTVRSADVTLLEFTQRKYRAEGSADPVRVRRVAVELGLGRKVQVRPRDSNALVGRIVNSDADQLYLKIGERGPVSVSCILITELKPRQMSGLVTLAMGAGVEAIIMLVAAAAV